MDLSIPGIPNSPLPTTAVFADNVQELLNAGALNVKPTGIIAVNSIDDVVNPTPGVTTLRDAIKKANADSGEDLIVFDRSLFSTAQTITLKLGELDITHSLDIIAPRDSLTGGDLMTVSGNNASRVFEIEKDATVNLSGLIVADGNGSGTNDNGGGIKNSGTLILDSSIVRNNSTGGRFSGGGGIYNNGTLTVDNSTISRNFALSGAGIYNTGNLEVNNSTIRDVGIGSRGVIGSGIYNTGTSTVNNSTITNNRIGGLGATAGGFYNTGTLTVSNSTISNNSAVTGGGGVNTGNLTITNSIISNNFAGFDGGGIVNSKGSTLTVDNSTISGNKTDLFGGGIDNNGFSTVLNSTISGNSASQGGGINNYGFSTVLNSTISGNSVSRSTISGNSPSKGGGIYNDYSGTLTLLFSTVTQNQAADGGGVYQSDVPTFSQIPGSNNVRNTIIAANLNSDGGVNPDVSGTFTSNGYNLIGDRTGSTGFDETIGDIVSDWVIDPRLDTLAFNGGHTQTIALLPDSPAIGAADPIALDTDPTTDQRGLPRRAADGSADIGAFEFS